MWQGLATLYLLLQFFFDTLVIDPDYSVLLDVDNNNNNNNNNCNFSPENENGNESFNLVLVVGCSVSIIGVAIIIATTFVIIDRKNKIVWAKVFKDTNTSQ